jgi:hypothetical protein
MQLVRLHGRAKERALDRVHQEAEHEQTFVTMFNWHEVPESHKLIGRSVDATHRDIARVQ